MRTFEEVWKATGYNYGEDALKGVKLGWELAMREHQMQRMCICYKPLPSYFPVGPEGAPCDNCGGWLGRDVANAAGQRALDQALEKR